MDRVRLGGRRQAGVGRSGGVDRAHGGCVCVSLVVDRVARGAVERGGGAEHVAGGGGGRDGWTAHIQLDLLVVCGETLDSVGEHFPVFLIIQNVEHLKRHKG